MAISARPLTINLGAEVSGVDAAPKRYAVADCYPRHRLMQRVTITGDRPLGP